jgi:hypothetical protein
VILGGGMLVLAVCTGIIVKVMQKPKVVWEAATFEERPTVTDTLLVKMCIDYHDYYAEELTETSEDGVGTPTKIELFTKAMKDVVADSESGKGNERNEGNGGDSNNDAGDAEHENDNEASETANSVASDDDEGEKRANSMFNNYNESNGHNNSADGANRATDRSDAESNDADNDAKAT